MGVTVELRDHVLLIGLDRPEKRNALEVALLDDLAAAYGLKIFVCRPGS